MTWTLEPMVVLGLLVVALWYACGVQRLWRSGGRGRGVRAWQPWAFGAGVLTIVAALMSPLDALADALFSAHMAQHLLLVLVAAPLLVLGNSLLPILWALPRRVRVGVGRWWMRAPVAQSVARTVTRPAVAWVLHLGALFFWHIPAPYGWALDHEAVHALEHACFLGTGVLFWWAAIEPAGRRRLGYGPAVLYVSSAGALMGGLGAILTLAPTPWYLGHIGRTAAWHLSPLADQQLAGAIMWVPSGFVYLAAAGVLFVKWLGAEEDDERALRSPPQVKLAQGGAQ